MKREKKSKSGSSRRQDGRTTAQSEDKMERGASFQLIFSGRFFVGPVVCLSVRTSLLDGGADGGVAETPRAAESEMEVRSCSRRVQYVRIR